MAAKRKGKTLAVIGIRGFPGVQGGVESHCCQLVPRLAKAMPVRVYRRKPYLGEASMVDIEGVTFADLPSTRVKGLEPVLHTFLSCMHLLTHHVDVVSVHNIGPGLFTPLLRLMGMKVVLTYHSANYEHAKWGPVARMILRLSEKVALGCSNRVIFVSSAQRDRYSQRVLRKSVAIPNGIVAVRHPQSTEFIEKHGLVPGRYVLAVGRLTPEKGFDDLIAAVNDNPDVEKLVLAGASDQEDGYRRKLHGLNSRGKVVFTGFTTGDDLAQLYENAAAFVLSSRNEGFPLVLLEAMSYGLKIVATDIPAAHLIPLPQTHYCRVGDVSDMSRAITEVLGETERPVYDLAAYDWDEIALATQDVIEGV